MPNDDIPHKVYEGGALLTDPDGLEKTLRVFKTRIDGQENDGLTLDARVGALEDRATDTENDIGVLVDRAVALEDRVDDAEADIVVLDSRAASLENDVSDVQSAVSDLSIELGTVDGRIGGVESRLDNLESIPIVLGPYEITLCGGRQTSETSPVTFAKRAIILGNYHLAGRVIKFKAWLETSDAAATCHLLLYNATTLATIHEFTSTETEGEWKEFTLTPGTIPETETKLNLRLWRSGGLANDIVSYNSAIVEMTYP